MRLDIQAGIDEGYDINVGDIIFIKYEVIEPPTKYGDVKLKLFPRNGKDEYAASRINAVFLKRPGYRWLKNILNFIGRCI